MPKFPEIPNKPVEALPTLTPGFHQRRENGIKPKSGGFRKPPIDFSITMDNFTLPKKKLLTSDHGQWRSGARYLGSEPKTVDFSYVFNFKHHELDGGMVRCQKLFFW